MRSGSPRALFQEGPFDAIYEIGSGISALPIFLALSSLAQPGASASSATPCASTSAACFSIVFPRHTPSCPTCATFSGPPSWPQGLQRRRRGARQCGGRVHQHHQLHDQGQEIDEIIAQMAGFRAVVVDLSRFFEVREKAAQAELLDRFIKAGWGRPAPHRDPIGHLLDLPQGRRLRPRGRLSLGGGCLGPFAGGHHRFPAVDGVEEHTLPPGASTLAP